MTRSAALLVMAACAVTPARVLAQAAEAGMIVGATVGRSCQIDGGSLTFGSYDPVTRHASAPLDGETIIVITCTRGTPAVVALDSGVHASGGRRFLGSGTDLLNYDLYQDPGRSLRWGDAPGDALTLGPSAGNPQSIYVYGRVPASQDVPIGAYTDSVVATVYF